MNTTRKAGVGLALFLLGATLTPDAQAERQGNAYSRTAQRGDESYDAEASKKAKVEVRFPNATRAEPKTKGSPRLAGAINKMIDAYSEDEFTKAIARADELLANPKATASDRAKAAQIAAYSWNSSDADNAYPEAIRYLKLAIEADALPNNDHFELMYVLAQMQLSEDQYADALATADRYLAETRNDKALVNALRGNALYRLDRFPEAAEALKKAIAAEPKPDKNWTQMLMASYFEMDQPAEAAKLAEQMAAEKPGDKPTLLNLAQIYLQAEQPEKAGEVFDRLHRQGLLTESKDYEYAYKLLANIDGREKDAIALINEGLGKAILTPSFEIYNFLGQSYYFSDQIEPAIDAWGKAAPLAKDGETYLNLAKVLVQEERYAQGKAAAQQALAKGVKKPGDAWMAIARAEYGDEGKNRAAILAAYKEAAKYPETKAQATKAIAQMSR